MKKSKLKTTNSTDFQAPIVAGRNERNQDRKKSALQQLNNRRASWALDQKKEPVVVAQNLNESGDAQIDPPPGMFHFYPFS